MAAKQHTFHVYKALNGQWYWRLRARNGRIIATGGEGYMRKSGALKDVESIQTKVTSQTCGVIIEE